MKILGQEVLIKRSKRRKSDTMGEYREVPGPTIWINTKMGKPSQAGTLIHEYFHAVAALVHDPDTDITEETAARLFETGVRDLWFNNRELLEALTPEERPDGQIRGASEEV